MDINYSLLENSGQSFEKIIDIQPLVTPPEFARPGQHLFQSKAYAFEPIPHSGRTYGGHVLGQSVWAAAHTVPEGYICHSQSSYFLVEGRSAVPFIYLITELRNGYNYLARECKTYQVESEELKDFAFQEKYLCFTSMMSFKRPQPKCVYNYEAALKPEFSASADEIAKMPEAPDADAPVLIAISDAYDPHWHPIDVRKRNTVEYNKQIPDVTKRRIVHYARSPLKLSRNPNMHVAVLLWISDRNSLFTIVNVQDNNEVAIQQLASLSHSFVLHDLNPIVDEGYLTMETWTDRAMDSRGLYNGRLYDQDKRLVASFIQDGCTRVAKL